MILLEPAKQSACCYRYTPRHRPFLPPIVYMSRALTAICSAPSLVWLPVRLTMTDGRSQQHALQGKAHIARHEKGPGEKRTADETRRVDKDAALNARKLRERIVANSAPTARS